MKKYFAIFRTGWEDALEYRTEFFISLLGWSVRLVLYLFIFHAVFQVNNVIADYTYSDIVVYFLLMQILMAFIFSRSGFAVANAIQTGDFSNFLLKPISYIAYETISEFSKNLLRSLMGGIAFGVILFIVKSSFFLQLSFLSVILAFVSMVIAYLLNQFIVMIIALLAFWIVASSRLLYMFFAILTIFSGMSIPINFYPEKFQNIVYLTPFPYIFYFPSQLLMNRLDFPQILQMFTYQIGFTLLCYLIVKTMLFFGTRKYEAVGR